MGQGGERLADHACSGLARPPSVQTCRRPACHTHITWHVTDYGLVGEMEHVVDWEESFYLSFISTLFTLFCLVSVVHQKLQRRCEGEESGLF